MKLNLPRREMNCASQEIIRKGAKVTQVVAVLSRSFSQRDDLKEIILFCAAGLLFSLVLIHYGVDLGASAL
jgi:hypothetical protein